MFQIIEYGSKSILLRTGVAQTTDDSIWTSIVDVDIALGSVYNKVAADYVAVTSSGKVTAFRVNIGTPTPCASAPKGPECRQLDLAESLNGVTQDAPRLAPNDSSHVAPFLLPPPWADSSHAASILSPPPTWADTI